MFGLIIETMLKYRPLNFILQLALMSDLYRILILWVMVITAPMALICSFADTGQIAAATSSAIDRAGIGRIGIVRTGAGAVEIGPETGTITASAIITAGTTAAGMAVFGGATGTRRWLGALSAGDSAH